MLSISRLSKTYANGTHALRGIDLEIEPGIFGLLGPNGAGKSTLMRTIAALQRPDRGRILLGGVDIVRHPQVVRERLGYLPQEFGVYPKISAWHLLDHLAVLKGVLDSGSRRRQIEALLHQTNLWSVRKEAVSAFSGGMRQRFGIAQALLGQPQVVIVDEPTAGLDPEERHRFHNLLAEIGERVVVVLSTHIVDDVRHLCPQMAIVNQGHIVAQGQPLELMRALHGQVWRKTVSRAELSTYQQMTLLSQRAFAGQMRIHVLANQQPDASFTAVEPDLEDVYFAVLRRGAEVES